MTQENKYYTPQIEEISVGFEYEETRRIEGWVPIVVDEESVMQFYEDHYHIGDNDYKISDSYRVKCLDEDDIISLGFELSDKIHPLYGRVIYEKISTDGFTFPPRKETTTLSLEQGRIRILFWEDNHYLNETIQLFYGKIKNKSDLKRLLVQLGIIKYT
jgi:hypothetical protein